MADKIGDFLLTIGAIKQRQVDDVLRAQEAGDTRMFGEIAIEFGYIDDNAIKRYLEYREKEQKAARLVSEAAKKLKK